MLDDKVIAKLKTKTVKDIRILKRYEDNEGLEHTILYINDKEFGTSINIYSVYDENYDNLIKEQEIFLLLFNGRLMYDLSDDNKILITYNIVENYGNPYIIGHIYTRDETHECFININEIFNIPGKYIENFNTKIKDGKLIINNTVIVDI